SGFRCGDKYGGWALLFDGLRKCILDGVNLSDKVQLYRNENYALMRILLHQVLTLPPRVIAVPFAVKSGEDFAVAPASSPQNKMQMPSKLPHSSTPQPPKWGGGDYAAFYIDYVNQVVFAPIGLPQLYCKPTDAEPALSYKAAGSDAYDFSSVQPGEIWGDMTLFCGSQGWNLSAHQLAIFMHGLTQSAGIVPTSVMQRMEDENLGLWYNDNGNGLASWSHGGYHPAESNKGEVNTLVVAFNNGLSAAVIVNSKFKGDDFFNQLVDAIKETPPVKSSSMQ